MAVAIGDQRQAAKLAIAKLPAPAQVAHSQAWSRIEQTVIAGRAKKALDFEVQHSIEHARKLYFAEVLKGSPAEVCEQKVLQAIAHDPRFNRFRIFSG